MANDNCKSHGTTQPLQTINPADLQTKLVAYFKSLPDSFMKRVKQLPKPIAKDKPPQAAEYSTTQAPQPRQEEKADLQTKLYAYFKSLPDSFVKRVKQLPKLITKDEPPHTAEHSTAQAPQPRQEETVDLQTKSGGYSKYLPDSFMKHIDQRSKPIAKDEPPHAAEYSTEQAPQPRQEEKADLQTKLYAYFKSLPEIFKQHWKAIVPICLVILIISFGVGHENTQNADSPDSSIPVNALVSSLPDEVSSINEITEENFISTLNSELPDYLSEGVNISSVTLSNRELTIAVDIEGAGTSLIDVNTWIIITTSGITDVVLAHADYDELWDAVTVDFGGIGTIFNAKSGIKTNSVGGRYFDSANFVINYTSPSDFISYSDMATTAETTAISAEKTSSEDSTAKTSASKTTKKPTSKTAKKTTAKTAKKTTKKTAKKTTKKTTKKTAKKTTKKTTSNDSNYTGKVYVTPTGKKYHFSKSCAGKNAMLTTMKNAKQFYDPCKKCAY
ncbi:MAG: hypothetical protein LBL82_05585 [Oscillospiraceae bacterium]|jgi:hypothetical protein|nr:hypothetical protein [Oscillospiraceae bacterium]